MPIKKEYTPSEVARILSEEYGHILTPSVIRKWDNLILRKLDYDNNNNRLDGDNRIFNNVELMLFNAIASLRSLGFDIENTRDILSATYQNKNIKLRIDKKIKGLKKLKEFV